MKLRMLWLGLLFLFGASRGFASAALLLEEPYGDFGYFNPTGHAAVYLSHVCADSPIRLRSCAPGELGVVVSRYHRVHGYDALAIPLIPYLYAVDRLAEVPEQADVRTVALLRDAWRQKHLEDVAPDGKDKEASYSDWTLLVGALYDRKIYAFEIGTTPSQDEAFIQAFNQRPNRDHFNIFFRNCADFARGVLDFYYPHSVRRSLIADLGMTTPKQVAKSLDRYAARHERLDLEVFILPQVAGSIPRSKHVDGVVEAMLRRKYVVPIAILHPYVAAGMGLAYLTRGRFDPGKNAVTLDRAEIVECMTTNQQPNRPQPALSFAESAGREGSAPHYLPAAQSISGAPPKSR